ncbi:HemK2/MTQ2 family protein methyltransferase [Streptomyces sp. NPDC008125]|uniref:HemK2/MTQ2 family protein methyltransferase n=1 Tax=Streptomyces sp. NPDC008125 TaxID=3364811 RepID=UPI0036EEE389
MGPIAMSAGAVTVRPRRTVRLPGVYAPQTDSYFLAAALRREGVGPGMDVLDLCTGTGTLAVRAAQLGARVTAVDISRRAVTAARVNASLAKVPVFVHRGDLLAALPGRRFDAVISNPPYVPAPRRTLPRHGPGRAWDAGPDGRALVDRICDAAPAALRSGGLLLMVHSALSRPDESVRRLERAGLSASVSDRLSIPFGPVLRGRLGWLRDSGLLPPGATTEELVIIRARKN